MALCHKVVGLKPESDIAAWVDQARAGDARGFRLLMERSGPWVLADCRHLSGSDDDAVDLSQEVFVKAYFSLDKLREAAAFEGWLKRIKVNHCINFLRRRRLVPEFQVNPDAPESIDTATPPWDPEEIDAERDRVLIGTVLGEMRDTLRLPLVMHDMDEYSYSEIAEELGIGISAAKMRIQRARQDFRERFEILRERAAAEHLEGT